MGATLLAIETSAKTCSVALWHHAALHEIGEPTEQPQHTRQILPQIQTLLTQAGLQLKQLDAIAFACGPGSFTGIRLGASVVQGLCYGADLPVIPISTLQILAQGVYTDLSASRVAVALNAFGGSLYWGLYQETEQGIMQAQVLDSHSPPDAVSLPEPVHDWVGAGDGWAAYSEILMPRFPDLRLYSEQYPHARDMIPLARARFAQQQYVQANEALPSYLYSADHWKKS